MLVTRTSVIPSYLATGQQQESDDQAGSRKERSFQVVEGGRQGSDPGEQTVSSNIPKSGALAYSPVLISISTDNEQSLATASLAKRSGVAAYQATERDLTDHPVPGQLLAASF